MIVQEEVDQGDRGSRCEKWLERKMEYHYYYYYLKVYLRKCSL